jgi:hypothetical protein
MANVYIEARPKGRQEGEPIEDYVVEDHADHVLKTFKTQHEAIEWAKKEGHHPLVACVRHINNKKNADHWRSADHSARRSASDVPELAGALNDFGCGLRAVNMPSHGSLVLSDFAAQYLTLVREPCGRRGRLNRTRLIDKQGDGWLTTDHVPTHGNCDKAHVFNLYDRCKARYALCP